MNGMAPAPDRRAAVISLQSSSVSWTSQLMSSKRYPQAWRLNIGRENMRADVCRRHIEQRGEMGASGFRTIVRPLAVKRLRKDEGRAASNQHPSP